MFTYLNIRAFKFTDGFTTSVENSNVESVAVWVADEDVSGVGNVDAIREVGQVLVTDTAQKHPVLVENNDAVALEIADKVLLAWNKAQLQCSAPTFF